MFAEPYGHVVEATDREFQHPAPHDVRNLVQKAEEGIQDSQQRNGDEAECKYEQEKEAGLVPDCLAGLESSMKAR